MFIWMKGIWVERCGRQMKALKIFTKHPGQTSAHFLSRAPCVWLVRVDARFILTWMKTRLCRIDVQSVVLLETLWSLTRCNTENMTYFMKIQHLAWIKSLFVLVFRRFCRFSLFSRFLPCCPGEMGWRLWAVWRFLSISSHCWKPLHTGEPYRWNYIIFFFFHGLLNYSRKWVLWPTKDSDSYTFCSSW